MSKRSHCRAFCIALSCLLACFESSGAVFLVSTGATWKYLDDGSNQGTAWSGTSFNDSTWLSGRAELGFGDTDEATPIRGGYITAYFRHYFTVQNPQDLTSLTVGLRRDDGGVVYLNGANVFASNMRNPPYLYDSLAFPTTSETAFFTNSVNPQLLVAGTNVLAVEVHQSSPTSTDISFELYLEAEGNITTPPIVLTAPQNNSSVRIFYPFTLAAGVSSGSTFSTVDFYAGADFVDSISAPPYEAQWVPYEYGPLALTAVLFENGVAVTSAPVVVNVVDNLAPTASIAAPPNGSVYMAGSDVFIGVNANDSDGSIASVQILTNGVPLVELTTPPYNFTWQNSPPGVYALRALATDNDGGSVTSSPVNISVQSSTLTVTITSPANNSTVPLSNIPFEAVVFDDSGVLAYVDFFVDGGKVGSVTNAPFTITLASLAPGPHTLQAVAVDNSSAGYFSQPVSVTASDASSSLLRGPYLQSCTMTSIIVRWRTDLSVAGVVRFGTNAAALNAVATESATTEHAVHVTGLSPNTRYFYSIGDGQNILASGADCFFVTAPASPKPTRLWVIGDFGIGGGAQLAVRDAYTTFTGSRYTDLWLMLGDNAYGSGTDNEYQNAVFNVYSPLLRQTCVWPTIGNHDAASGPRGHVYSDIFSLPVNGEAGGVPSGTERYYSYDYGDIHFVVLDSTFSDRNPGSPMFTWLEQDLAARTKLWTIAYWHHPPYTRGTHNSEVEHDLIQMRENALPILEAHNVDLVLCGHSHVYERSFLLNGHYGFMASLSPSMVLDGGSGRTNETGAYHKGAGPNLGTVYAVVGCSGQVGGGILDHPAFFVSYGGIGGSLVVDVDGDRLDAKFLSGSGTILDTFTLIKSVEQPPLTILRSSTEAAIYWPVTAETFILEKTADLNPPASWSVVTNAVQQDGSRYVVFVPSSENHQYFRLRR